MQRNETSTNVTFTVTIYTDNAKICISQDQCARFIKWISKHCRVTRMDEANGLTSGRDKRDKTKPLGGQIKSVESVKDLGIIISYDFDSFWSKIRHHSK